MGAGRIHVRHVFGNGVAFGTSHQREILHSLIFPMIVDTL